MIGEKTKNMILFEYKGEGGGKYLYVSQREDLKKGITWLQKQLQIMEQKEKLATTVMDCRGEE